MVTLQTKQFVLSVDSKELCLIRTLPRHNSRLEGGLHVFKDNYNLGHEVTGKILLKGKIQTFNLIKLSEWQVYNARRAETQVRQAVSGLTETGRQKFMLLSSVSDGYTGTTGELDSHGPCILLPICTLSTFGAVFTDRGNTRVSYQAGHKLGTVFSSTPISHTVRTSIICHQMRWMENDWMAIRSQKFQSIARSQQPMLAPTTISIEPARQD